MSTTAGHDPATAAAPASATASKEPITPPPSASSRVVSSVTAVLGVTAVLYAAVNGHHRPLLARLPASAEPVFLTSAFLLATAPLAPKLCGGLSFAPPFAYLWYQLTVVRVFGELAGMVVVFFSIVTSWIAFALLNERVIRPWFKSSSAISQYFGGPLRPAAVAGMNMDRAIAEHEAAPHKKQLSYYQGRRAAARAKVVRLTAEIATVNVSVRNLLEAGENASREERLAVCLADHLADLKVLEHTLNVRCDDIAGTINRVLNSDAWNTKWR